MDKKWLTIVILAASIPLILIIFDLITPDQGLSPTGSTIEDCNTLEFNDESSTNLVFFSSKSEASKYKDFFQETAPYKENKKSFNFYYIDSYEPECELYKGIATLCHSKELVKKASSCPNDLTLVIDDQPSNIRSSSYQNVLSINKNHPLTVLTHEFGHAFANLAEEYTPARLPSRTENCVQSCESFSYEINGCFKGCSQSTYFRSIDSGVMRTLNSNEYGKLNEALILERINKPKLSITGKAITNENQCDNKLYYLIEGSYQGENIVLIDKTLEVGCLGQNGAGPFNYQLKTNANEILTESDFNPEFIFTSAPSDSGIDAEVFESDKNFFLKIPKIPQAESLTILKENQELANIRLNDIGARACII
jgi:hypothetical protein